MQWVLDFGAPIGADGQERPLVDVGSRAKRFEFGRLKIDQSFVRRLTTDRQDEAIVHAIIQMAQELQLVTIAEGVESAAVLARLLELGCNAGQGLFWSAALPAEEFAAYARRHRALGWKPRLA
jgi:diguanylate cyclase